jgi:hypothetical protein
MATANIYSMLLGQKEGESNFHISAPMQKGQEPTNYT